MSSGVPIRLSGADAAIESPKRSRVAAIILLSKGPGAMAFTVMCRGASFLARVLLYNKKFGTAKTPYLVYPGFTEYVANAFTEISHPGFQRNVTRSRMFQ